MIKCYRLYLVVKIIYSIVLLLIFFYEVILILDRCFLLFSFRFNVVKLYKDFNMKCYIYE